jgi:hypothetical protein
LAASTLTILFSEMFQFLIFKEHNFVKQNILNLQGILYFVKMEFAKLIEYSTYMCVAKVGTTLYFIEMDEITKFISHAWH